MTVRKLQSDGDITTSGTQFINEKNELAQTIKTRFNLYLGEYFRDISDGTPWFQSILGKDKNENVREAVIKRRVLQTEGVISLFEFAANFDLQSRKYSVTMGIVTVHGDIPLTISGSI